MPRNAKRLGNAASTSFRRDEVGAFQELIRVLRRGGDATVLLRSDPMHRLQVKFARMHDSIEEQRRFAREAS